MQRFFQGALIKNSFASLSAFELGNGIPYRPYQPPDRTGNFATFNLMRNFFRILAYGKPYRHFAALNAVFNLLGTLFHLASLLLFIPFLRLLLGQVQLVHEPVGLER